MAASEDDLPADVPADEASPRRVDDGPGSFLDLALDSLKRPRGDADEYSVTSEAPTRMNWSSVTDAEPETPTDPETSTESRPAPAEESSFRFDLGSALARLGGDAPDVPIPADEPTRGPAGDADDHRAVTSAADAPTSPPPAPTELPQRQAPVPESVAELPQRESSVMEPAAELPQRQAPVPESVAELPQRQTPSPQQPDSAGLPQRTPAEPSAELPTRQPTVDEQLPRRQPPAPAPAQPTAAPVAPPVPPTPDPVETSFRAGTSGSSVFDDAAPAPTLPSQTPAASYAEPAAPVIPPGAIANLPTLPAPVPAAPAPVSEASASSPATPDIHAVRSYQLKAQREQRRGRLFGRTLLALFLLGGAVAAALTLGRSYLFPTEWDSTLTPIVNQIQEERGGEFVETVPLDVLPAEEYAPIVLELSVGTDWAERMPDWRALGVATGSADSSAITDAAIAWRPAIYDPATNKVVQVADGDPEATTAALTLALEDAYERQQGATPADLSDQEGVGVLGVSSLEAVNSRAIDRHLLGGPGTFEVDPEAQVPLPLLYEWLAIETLGEPLVAAAGPEGTAWSYGEAYPDDVLAATEVSHDQAVVGPLPDGTESLAEPVSLGIDNWTLIWRNRLPERTVERLATLVTADAYRPVQRGNARCFVGTFTTGTETAAADLLGSMTLWVSNGPAGAAGTATLVGPTQIEIFSCDPGAEAGFVVDPGAVNSILAVQTARL